MPGQQHACPLAAEHKISVSPTVTVEVTLRNAWGTEMSPVAAMVVPGKTDVAICVDRAAALRLVALTRLGEFGTTT